MSKMPFPRPYDVYDDTGYGRNHPHTQDARHRTAPRDTHDHAQDAMPHNQARQRVPGHDEQHAHAHAQQQQQYQQQYGQPQYGQHQYGQNQYGQHQYGQHQQQHQQQHQHQQQQQQYGQPMMPMDPLQAFGSMIQPHGGDAFGPGTLFGSMRGMMPSFDQMFDQMVSGGNGGSGQTFFYESKSRTVGPDGRVREEVVRTVPGADGAPQTQRSVRQSDIPSGDHTDPFVGGTFGAAPRAWTNPPGAAARAAPTPAPAREVVVEELDENGNVISSSDGRNVLTRRDSTGSCDSRDEARGRDHGAPHHTAHGERCGDRASWWQDRYRHWRGNRK